MPSLRSYGEIGRRTSLLNSQPKGCAGSMAANSAKFWKILVMAGQSGLNPEGTERCGVRFIILPPSPVSVRVALCFETAAGVVRLHDSGPIFRNTVVGVKLW